MQKNFGLFWSGLLISAVWDQISTVTIAWHVYVITESRLQLAQTGFFALCLYLYFQ